MDLDIEMKLDEADRAAAADNRRLTEDELFGRMKDHIRKGEKYHG